MRLFSRFKTAISFADGTNFLSPDLRADNLLGVIKNWSSARGVPYRKGATTKLISIHFNSLSPCMSNSKLHF